MERFPFCLLCEEGERSAKDEGERGRAFGVYACAHCAVVYICKEDRWESEGCVIDGISYI